MAYKVPGPVTVWWNDLDLGVTREGVIIRPRTGWTPIIDDMHGEEPASFIYTGKSMMIDIIALDEASVDTANPWASALLSIASNAVGTLGSAVAKTLKIIERDATYWFAERAIPLDPSELALSSTQEMRIPISFLIIPDANRKLFSATPAYVTS